MDSQIRILIFLSLAYLCHCHIVLTFPPARSYLDFLDNVRTPSPCGTERDPNNPVTVLTPGQEINVTWHIAYAHRGGFYIELLQDEMVYNLTEPGGEFMSVEDATKLQKTVTIPAEVKGNATLRVVRQAAEWSTNIVDVPYLFWTCADLLIDDNATCNRVGDDIPCSGRGTCNGTCDCERLSFGDYCQYEDNCANEADCNNNGQCHDLLSTSYPKRQCFCEDGFFGVKCENENPSDFTVEITKGDFFRRNINDEITLFYRILQDNDEIEIAVEARTNTWLAIGWRPAGLTDTCKSEFSDGWIGNEPESEPESEPDANGRRRRHSGPDIIIRERENVDNECSTDNGTNAEPEGTAEPESEPEGTAEPESEPEATAEPEGEPAPGGPLHPMDCMDMVIGMAYDLTSNIGDYYTLDRSTPLRDNMYGGSDRLVAAGGKEVNGVTTIVFRKKLEGREPSDHTIMNGPTTVMWARGQEYGAYIHSPSSSIESCTASITDFYRQDELKYHGTSGNQRGLVQDLNFFVDPEASECTRMVSHPPGCLGSECNYVAEWALIDDSSDIRFSVSAKVEPGRWSGVGFSPNGQMIGSDAVLGWVDSNGNGVVKDFFLGDKASNVLADDQQDLKDMVANYKDGSLTLEFTKNGATSDIEDITIYGKCMFLLLPDVGGPVSNGQPLYHSATPKSTPEMICFTPCDGETSHSVSVHVTSWLAVICALLSLILNM